MGGWEGVELMDSTPHTPEECPLDSPAVASLETILDPSGGRRVCWPAPASARTPSRCRHSGAPGGTAEGEGGTEDVREKQSRP